MRRKPLRRGQEVWTTLLCFNAGVWRATAHHATFVNRIEPHFAQVRYGDGAYGVLPRRMVHRCREDALNYRPA